MNKQELIERVAAKTGCTKKNCGLILDGLLDEITEALQRDEKVKLVNFGSFEVTHRAARVGRNPQNRETIQIPARGIPFFKAGKQLKEAVNPEDQAF